MFFAHTTIVGIYICDLNPLDVNNIKTCIRIVMVLGRKKTVKNVILNNVAV